MEKVLEKSKCTGCSACNSICPKNAITMKEDKDGFKYPIIDNDKCINCKLCKKTCPVINTKTNESVNECYAAFNKNEEERFIASSGGIFGLIASIVLKEKGIVIGSAFDSENNLKHIAISKKKDLNQLKGSKYLQSDLDNIFKFIKKNIKDKKILFVGTPCQVAGLKAFIKDDNLICLDLACHGVPTPKLFKKYIKELEEKENAEVLNYNFRDNSTGWDTYSNKITFKNKTEIIPRNNDYMNLFLADNALRESCYNCNFKIGNKYSDITLGDFWGIKKHYPEMYNEKGVSAVIINTSKGEKILEQIKSELEYKSCQLEEITSGNPSLIRSAIKTDKREKFFNDLDNKSVKYLSKHYTNKPTFLRRVKNKIKKLIH